MQNFLASLCLSPVRTQRLHRRLIEPEIDHFLNVYPGLNQPALKIPVLILFDLLHVHFAVGREFLHAQSELEGFLSLTRRYLATVSTISSNEPFLLTTASKKARCPFR